MSNENNFDNKAGMMTAKEVAQYIGLSESWVRRHKNELGSMKLGGSRRFRKVRIDEYLSTKEQENMDVRLQAQRTAVHESRVQDEKSRPISRSRKKERGDESAIENQHGDSGDPNRYGLLDSDE